MESLTDKEKTCLIYGFIRGLAVSDKESDLFKDLTLDELVDYYLNLAIEVLNRKRIDKAD